jgi:hypothetical protein
MIMMVAMKIVLSNKAAAAAAAAAVSEAQLPDHLPQE